MSDATPSTRSWLGRAWDWLSAKAQAAYAAVKAVVTPVVIKVSEAAKTVATKVSEIVTNSKVLSVAVYASIAAVATVATGLLLVCGLPSIVVIVACTVVFIWMVWGLVDFCRGYDSVGATSEAVARVATVFMVMAMTSAALASGSVVGALSTSLILGGLMYTVFCGRPGRFAIERRHQEPVLLPVTAVGTAIV